eukprot:CAMPEP_0172513556 /NCGR_PEP_ID=MMETSP1066-20121228/253563_1 /TAXON_ID=671091 /ORGANISM="Coscinodiscus wailesii, Strain CCMP2513" /LENGTH=70 /DNA_ID=CAMNT_0013293883 /DNA_START=279 /DNA_END=491 /DNA_ORIENTATION=-
MTTLAPNLSQAGPAKIRAMIVTAMQLTLDSQISAWERDRERFNSGSKGVTLNHVKKAIKKDIQLAWNARM